MSAIRIERQEPKLTVQVNARLSPELAKRLKLFAVENQVTVQAVVEAGVLAALTHGRIVGETGARAAAKAVAE